jgi:uncharacterized protein YjbI with pentapeptide repeats
VGFFDKRKLKAQVRAKGRIPPSHFNHFTIEGESRTDERFDRVRWDAISISASHLVRCIFEDVHAESVNLGGGLFQSTYRDCIFEGCDFAFGAIGDARFSHCSFKRCRLFHLFGTKLEMIDCSFAETRIEKAVFHGSFHAAVPGTATREKNEFTGNDLSTADLIDVDFRGGIDLSKQILPSGPEYIYVADTHRAAKIAHELIAELDPKSPDARRVESARKMLEYYHSTGQKQQLLRLSGCDGLTDRFRRKLS